VTDTQILIAACIATVAYAATFMVVFDRAIAWSERQATQVAAVAEIETAAVEAPLERAMRRPLRGLAAEPTVLPRAVSGLSRLSRPVAQKDDGMQDMLGRLDAIPSTRAAAA
jgi:hypothetical protein